VESKATHKFSDEEKLAYEQGSEACQNYSRLTMTVRTLSQQIMAVSFVGFIAALSSKTNNLNMSYLLGYGGIAVVIFSVSLLVVDWHYQSAFTAIRNALARLEVKVGIVGPWRSHLIARTRKRDHLASYLPFLLLWLLGFIISGVGFNHSISWSITILACLFGIGLFTNLLFRAARNDLKDLEYLETMKKE